MIDTNGHRTKADEIPRLPEVQEGQATAAVREVFEEITATIRAPFVGLFWRVLAADPDVLRLAWEAVAPNLRSWAVEDAGAALARRALFEEAGSLSSHKAFKGDLVRAEIDFDLRSKIGNFSHIAYYALPKHLLAVTMLAEVMEGRTVAGAGDQAGEIPYGLAEGAVPVSPLDPTAARGRAADLLPEIAAGHGHPTAEDYFRSLARLPDYLSAAWNAIRPIVRDEAYDERGRELVTMARHAMESLPYPVTIPPGTIIPPQTGDFTRLLRLFRDQILPDVLMDAALIVALTDGPDEAGRSRYGLRR